MAYLILSFVPLQAQVPTSARVKVGIASVLANPRADSEQLTQALLWDRVTILDNKNGWSKVLISDQYRTDLGYPGWIKSSALEYKPANTRDSIWVSVSSPTSTLREEPGIASKKVMTVFLATSLPLDALDLESARRVTSGEPWLKVRLPNSRAAWVREQDTITKEPSYAVVNRWVVDKSVALLGTPYLWGGTSARGIDCSGLTYLVYRNAGVILPRDADQQFEVGQEVELKDLQYGDLLFFGNSPQDITHVGIYAGDNLMIDATSRSGVSYVEVLGGWYKDHFQGARRMLDSKETRRLTPRSRQ